MLQQKSPDDFVIATGVQNSVREFVTKAFKILNIIIEWNGSGLEEKGVDVKTGKVLIEVDSNYYRPAEVETLVGDPKKAKETLGWNPSETSFDELINKMVKSDLNIAKNELRRKNINSGE